MNKDEIFNAILEKEGGYVNHADDRGGPTNWGITQVTARAHGYDGDMQKLTRQQALDILNADYWIAPRFFLLKYLRRWLKICVMPGLIWGLFYPVNGFNAG